MPLPATPPKKPRQVVDLELDSVALTENPSNEAAEIFIVRSKEAPVADLPEEVARAAEALKLERAALQADLAKLKADNAALLEVQRTQGAELERSRIEREKALCADAFHRVAPNLKAKDVDGPDLLYRIRAAAKLAGDDKMESEFLALLRVGNAGVVDAKLIRTIGSGGGEEEAPELPAEVSRILAPYMKAADNDVARAHKAANEDIAAKAAKNPRDTAVNRAYLVLRDFNPNAARA